MNYDEILDINKTLLDLNLIQLAVIWNIHYLKTISNIRKLSKLVFNLKAIC
ncbi:hypothetical protein NMY3_01846 [Candidatus Nitrosocosmicus oleophilus]|uniref:Uncharacterized protein n=1 Tax=Candidatus Nitrosocosmicus oleophilus TaxID=1353260 RepID=A0A654M0M3_9ARCH|nr:hypothetical protein NMY3_01846 [Candidatus Nitrosocosmicus oleophilus]